MADAVVAAHEGQKTPDGYCARGMTEDDIMDGAGRSALDALADATIAADQVLVF